MTFRVEALPAGPGDALVVEWGTRGKLHRMLVDAGPRADWPVISARLRARRTDAYEVFVITHVDEDHIGGSLELLDDHTLAGRVRSVWFNGFVHSRAGGDVLGPVHGEQLTKRIVDTALPWNIGWPGAIAPGLGGPVVAPARGDLPTVALPGGARAVLLSPDGKKLKRMAREWQRAVEKAGLVPGDGADGLGAVINQRARVFPDLPALLDAGALGGLAARKQADSSAANGSSIAFVLEYGGRRLLLAGDAHPDVLAAGLARYGAMVGQQRPRLDLVKLPHHGSGANLTDELAAAWTASRFLVSTDGTGYAHPDDSAIARLILAGGRRPTIYVNHPGGGPARWAARGEGAGATLVLAKGPTAGITVAV